MVFSGLASSVFFQELMGASQTGHQHPSPLVLPLLLPPILTQWNCFLQNCPLAFLLKKVPQQGQFIPSQPPTLPWILRKQPQVLGVCVLVCGSVLELEGSNLRRANGLSGEEGSQEESKAREKPLIPWFSLSSS